jgi:long-chain acyl-CoA synthetase
MTESWSAEILGRVRRETIDGHRRNAYVPRPANIVEMLARSVERAPQAIAFVEGDRRTGYAAFDRMVKAFAAELAGGAGVRQGDRVAVVCRNTHVFCVAVFAALRLGAIVVPISSRLVAEEVDRLLADAEPRLIVTEDRVRAAALAGGRFPVRLVEGAADLPTGVPSPASLPEVAIDEDDVAFLMFTSGTTGAPKGAMLTHRNVVHGVLNYHLCYGVGADDVTVIAVPIFHGTGLMAQLMTMVGVGGTSVLLPRFSAAETLALFAREKATYFIAPPTVYTMLLAARDGTTDLSGLRRLVVGGASLPPVLWEAVREAAPNAFFINTYGLTEATSPALMTPLDLADRHAGRSVGLASPCMEARIVDPMSGEDVADGEVGELLVAGSLVCRGYWRNPEATARAFVDGWLRTGDVARRGPDGFLFVCDRLKDMINRGGEKVFSVEVENVLTAHPDVVEAAVVPSADPVYGEVVRAVVVRRPGSTLDAEAVRAWAGRHLARFKIPQIVDFVDALPRNPSGKVVKQSLSPAAVH